jgi:hypothetical protein
MTERIYAIKPYLKQLEKLAEELTIYAKGTLSFNQSFMLLKQQLPVNPISQLLITRKTVLQQITPIGDATEFLQKKNLLIDYLDEQIGSYLLKEPVFDVQGKVAIETGRGQCYLDRKACLFAWCVKKAKRSMRN